MCAMIGNVIDPISPFVAEEGTPEANFESLLEGRMLEAEWD